MAMDKKIKVLVIDDSAMMRKLLSEIAALPTHHG